MSEGRRTAAGAFAIGLLAVMLGLAGCGGLTITDASQPAAAVQVAERDRHDLAVLSVDVDPPLGKVQLGSKEPALLVAVDNRGTQTESGVVVEARLVTDDPALPAARLVQLIGPLAPGEVKVVRLQAAGEIPLKSSYWLTVLVEPVGGEVNLANNGKTLRIDVLAALSGS